MTIADLAAALVGQTITSVIDTSNTQPEGVEALTIVTADGRRFEISAIGYGDDAEAELNIVEE